MLRDLDLNRQNCNIPPEDQNNINKIPLTNEHGDTFLRHSDYDDCGPISGEAGYEDFPPHQQYYNNNQRPSPVESDYFYDQYVDYPINETTSNALNNTPGRFNQTSPFVDFNQNKFNQNQNQIQLPPSRPPPSSQFTFFGHPLPSLTLNNVWGAGRTANNRATSGETTRGKGRVQIFRPGDPELQVIVNRPSNDIDQLDNRNREPAASDKKPVVDSSSLEKMDEKFYRPYPYFQTPFSPPKTEKGFSPMIPGVIVGGFIPIQDPTRNETEDHTKRNDWPQDDGFKEVQLVTKSDQPPIKRNPTKPASFGIIDKVGSSTVSHLTTSISPILSTLVPKVELMTEKTNVDESVEQEEIDETSHETESRIPNKFEKMNFEEEIYRNNQEMEHKMTPSYPSTSYSSSTTENVLIEYNNDNFVTPPVSSTTESEPNNHESAENFDDLNDNFNGSSSLSAGHLIAPGSIISHDPTPYKAPILPGKAGKITKVVSPSPPVTVNVNSNEISKLLSPFYPQQQSSEPPTGFDNEYQPNQIYTQTFNDNERISEAPQYERDDMEWYFNNYNQSQSNPILNYNLQPFDNYERSSATKLTLGSISSAIVLIVIRILMF